MTAPLEERLETGLIESFQTARLTSKQYKPVLEWFREQPRFYQRLQAFAGRYDIQFLKDERRRTTKKPIISHPILSQRSYILANRNSFSKDTRGIDNLLMLFIRMHDVAEEYTSVQVRSMADVNVLDKAALREGYVTKVSSDITSVIATVKREENGSHSLEDWFDGIHINTVIPEVIDKLTPGKETNSVIGGSYIEVIKRIFEGGSDEAKFLAAIAKCYDRAQNTESMFADITSVQKATKLTVLRKKFDRLESIVDDEKYGVQKETYIREGDGQFRKAKQENLEILDPWKRNVEIYKDFLLANEIVNFLGKTADTNTALYVALRERLITGVKHLLETVRYHAEQQALILTVHRDLGRNETVSYHETMDAARTYVASEEASELQLKPGRKKDERFEGTIARLHLVETKDDKTLASYKDNFNIQRQDALMLHTYAERILTDIKQYETRTHEHKLDPTTPPASFDDIRRIEQNLARFFSRSQ